jgi:hypothetical protein
VKIVSPQRVADSRKGSQSHCRRQLVPTDSVIDKLSSVVKDFSEFAFASFDFLYDFWSCHNGNQTNADKPHDLQQISPSSHGSSPQLKRWNIALSV